MLLRYPELLLRIPTIRGFILSELGEILRDARQKRNLSLAEVALATRIKEPYLEALEEGEYSLLPGSAYVTGFLRNYARFLGLHPDDVTEEYHALRPQPEATVRSATRVLASGHERYNRKRLFWALGVLILCLAGGYAIKQYNDTYAHPYSAPLLTPANLGSTSAPVHQVAAPQSIRLHLQADTTVWVRVTADQKQVFQGKLRPSMHHKLWIAHHSIYVLTLDGARVRARYDGRAVGYLSTRPGLIVAVATPAGWRRVS